MAAALPTQLPGDRVKKALQAFCELQANNPGQSRTALLEKVERQFDLTPLECEFLQRQLLDEFPSTSQKE